MRRNKIRFFLTFLMAVIYMLPSVKMFAQSQFQRTIGGSLDDQACAIVRTVSGYTVAGSTDSFGPGGYYFYLVKLDFGGDTIWTKTYGGVSNIGANSMVKTSDGGYVIAGTTGNPGPVFNDVYVAKIDSSGNLEWSKAIGGRGDNEAFSVVQTSDGGYAIAGFTDISGSNDFLVIKLDGSGNLQWCKSIGQTGLEYGASIIQTSEGGYAVAGVTNSFGAGGTDMYIVKLDAAGNLQWSRTVGGPSFDEASSIIQTSDGGYALAGSTESFGNGNGNEDMYIVKLNSGGNLQWTRTIGGTGDDVARSIIQTSDGGYAIAGEYDFSGPAHGDMYIVKLNSTGNLQWSRKVGGSGQDDAKSIIQTTDGGYAVAGFTSSFGAGSLDMYIVKFTGNGNTCSNMSIPVSNSSSGGTLGNPSSIIYSRNPSDSAQSWLTGTGGTVTPVCTGLIFPPGIIIQLNSFVQNYVNTNVLSPGHGQPLLNQLNAATRSIENGHNEVAIVHLNAFKIIVDAYTFTGILTTAEAEPLISLANDAIDQLRGRDSNISQDLQKDYALEQNYPNPFNPATTIRFRIPADGEVTLKVFDITGKEVALLLSDKMTAGEHAVRFDASTFASGVYFYKIETDNFTDIKKMILVK